MVNLVHKSKAIDGEIVHCQLSLEVFLAKK